MTIESKKFINILNNMLEKSNIYNITSQNTMQEYQ